jgi:hypothetical protein
VAISITLPTLTWWWFRPDSSDARVGEQSAVVWKWLKRSPSSASRSKVGVWMPPPKLVTAPKLAEPG